MAASYGLLLSVLTFKESNWMFGHFLCLYKTELMRLCCFL